MEDMAYVALRDAVMPKAEAYADQALGIGAGEKRDHRWDRLFLSAMDIMVRLESVEQKITQCNAALTKLIGAKMKLENMLEGR